MDAYLFKDADQIRNLIEKGEELPLALQDYPSRGQTAVQKLYQTKSGKLFLKKVNDRNHRECRIDVESGTLAEREFWAHKLADVLGLNTPPMTLLDPLTTVQAWLDLPDAHHFITEQGPLTLNPQDVFECACFDWLTGQIDRHDANYLYDFVNQKIILIDSAFAFLKYNGSLPHYLQMFEISSSQTLASKQNSRILQKLETTRARLTVLVPLKAASECYALKRRLDQLLTVKSVADIIGFYRKPK